MCRQDSCLHLRVDEAAAMEERLLIYCKPVELYNILRSRALHNPSFLRRCLRYKIQARHKKRLRGGIVIFNYRDYNNMLQKTEVTEGFSCPLCLMGCASFKGLRYHLTSSHDLFHYEFWVAEEYQTVNVSVNINISETVADGAVPQLHTFFFCSKPQRRRPKNLDQKQIHVQFLELDSPRLTNGGILKGFLGKDDDALSCKDEKASTSFRGERDMLNGRHGLEIFSSDCPSSIDCIERVASSSNGLAATISMVHSSMDHDTVKPPFGSDTVFPTKGKKLTMERSDTRNRQLLQKRQFYHSHRVQPMALEQVLSDRDSEDEVDDGVADLEDKRMLDDFVDVTKDEKQLMHLWNSFVRKQRVLADGHIPWACEAFSKLHGRELVFSRALFWCWRLFMIKLWNHGLLDGSTMNSCNVILESYRNDELLDPMRS